jgi:hypothetical protein
MKTLLLAVAMALVVAPVAGATPEQDRELFDVMAGTGLYLYPIAVDNAYLTCDYVHRGPGREQAMDDLWAANPEWSHEQVRTFIDASVRIYCPLAPDKARHKVV